MSIIANMWITYEFLLLLRKMSLHFEKRTKEKQTMVRVFFLVLKASTKHSHLVIIIK